MELYTRPANVFVAGFIGSPAMNLVAGEIGAERRSVVLPGGLQVSLARTGLPEPGTRIVFGVRPEHVKLATGAPDLELPVAAVETLGADAFAHCRLADGVKDRQDEFVVRLPGFTRVVTGDRLPLRIDKGTVHLFDSASGKRLSAI